MKAPLPRLHAITNEQIAGRGDLERVARELASSGTLAFHARGHALSGRAHLELARRLPPPVFVNDRLDVALAVRATGVQLSQDGLSVADARRIEPGWWIGRSVHNVAEAEAALAEGADYLVVGSVYPTTTHPERTPLGIAAFARIAALGRPALAIGGVTRDRALELVGAGAYGVAAISALWDAPDPAAAARALLEVFA